MLLIFMIALSNTQATETQVKFLEGYVSLNFVYDLSEPWV